MGVIKIGKNGNFFVKNRFFLSKIEFLFVKNRNFLSKIEFFCQKSKMWLNNRTFSQKSKVSSKTEILDKI